jgi:hypothetical protein
MMQPTDQGLRRDAPDLLNRPIGARSMELRSRAGYEPMGIRDKPIASGSPWQNGYAEIPIGTIRRECVGHTVASGEWHLRHALKS